MVEPDSKDKLDYVLRKMMNTDALWDHNIAIMLVKLTNLQIHFNQNQPKQVIFPFQSRWIN
jgi:hypothetical protein